MREKYIDSAVGGICFIFGIHADGCVDVANESGDIFTHISKDKAESICAARGRFLEELYKILNV